MLQKICRKNSSFRKRSIENRRAEGWKIDDYHRVNRRAEGYKIDDYHRVNRRKAKSKST